MRSGVFFPSRSARAVSDSASSRRRKSVTGYFTSPEGVVGRRAMAFRATTSGLKRFCGSTRVGGFRERKASSGPWRLPPASSWRWFPLPA